LDNLLQIPMPSTPLTTILRDFRSYRPGNHRAFLAHIAATSLALDFKTYSLSTPDSATLYLQLLNEVRDFRWRHWCFTREYILKRTSHPVATGGSPIVTWLPNQLVAVLDAMGEVWEMWGGKLRGGEAVMDVVKRQRENLRKEVDKWCKERGVDV
jgi:indoleamine 2,3-dioxygenase